MPPIPPLPASPLQCSLHDWETLQSRLIFAFDKELPAGVADGSYVRQTGEYSAWLLRSGSIRLSSDQEQRVARPGEWLFCFGRHIRQNVSPGARLLSIRVSSSWADDMALFVPPRSSIVGVSAAMLPQLEATAQKLLNDLGQLEWIGQDDPSYTFRWRTRLNFAKYLEHKRHLLEWTELIAGILGREGGDIRIPRGVDSRLAETLNLLDDLPFDAPFPGRRLAAGRGLTLGQLNRMCLRHSALTLHGYWDKRRIDRACTLLNQPASSIKGAASALGFTRLSHFSTWFKRHTGQSPRTYHRAAMATASP